MWMFFQVAGFLALLLTLYIYASGVVLKGANDLGRECIPHTVSETKDNFRPMIAIVSFSDEGGVGLAKSSSPSPRARGFRGLMGIVKSNKKSYAKMWGYDFIDARSSIDWSRPASWSKIPAIRSHLDKYDWIFWNDADSLVTNPIIRLESIIQSVIRTTDAGNDDCNDNNCADLIVTEDVNGVNAGLFFVRRSKWSMEFLDKWWNMSSFIIRGSKKSGDNDALIHYVKSLSPSEMWNHVSIAPMQCIFNSYPWTPTWKSIHRLIFSPSSYWKGAYSNGDFMVHLAGLDDKTEWALKIIQEIKPPSFHN